MFILREENNKTIDLMVLLATTCVNRTSNNVSSINSNGLRSNIKNLSASILNTYYTDQLGKALASGIKPKGFIKNKPDSWMNLIDINKFDSKMSDFNLLPVNDEAINNVVNRLAGEIEKYRSVISFNVAKTITTINDYKNSLKPGTNITDMFAINVVRPMGVLKLLRDKELLSYNITAPMVEEFTEIRNMKNVFEDLTNIANDPEIAMNMKEELSTMDQSDIIEDIGEIMDGDIIKGIRNITVREINVLICLAASVSDKLRDNTPGSALYNELNAIMKELNLALAKLSSKYDRLEENKTLIMSFKNKKDVTVLYVIGGVYDEYMLSKKGMKPLVGAYLSPLVQNRDIKGIEMFVNIKLSTIMDGSNKFSEGADAYNKTLMLKRQNDDVGKIRTYYIFGVLDSMNDSMFDAASKEDVKAYISKANISELNDVETTVLKIFKDYALLDTNLGMFIDGTMEGSSILGKTTDPKIIAGYATLKLVTLYLASQTTIV